MWLGQRSASRSNAFDALRFLAALLVIFSHSFPLTGAGYEPIGWLTGYQSGGALAVHVFFTISGFLIAKSWCDRPNLLDYSRKRLFRIMPAFVAAAFFVVLIVGPLATSLPLKDYFRNSGTWQHLNNIFMYKLSFHLPGVFENNPFKHAVNGSLWSLPIEVYMYLLVPIFGGIGLLLGKMRGYGLIALATAIVAFDWHFASKPENVKLVYFYIPVASATNCAVYFCIGSLFYTFRDSIRLSNELALVACVLLVLGCRTPYAKLAFLLGLPYLVFWFAYSQDWLSGFGKNGDFSYGMYIYAFPVQQLIVMWVPGIAWGHLFLFASAATLCLAILSWRYIERPCLNYARGWRTKPTLKLVRAA